MHTDQICTQKGKPTQGRSVSRLVKLAALGGAVLLSTGCAGMVNIGASEFNCPSPDGVQCKSAREIYDMTHDGEVPEPTKHEKKGIFSKKKTTADAEDKSDSQQSTTSSSTKEGNKTVTTEADPVTENYVAPRLPDRPIPIRTPAHVMRIWVAPWEDTNGDLITNGYVYTEIEPRRWVVGKPESVGAPILRPLQRVEPSKAQPAASQ